MTYATPARSPRFGIPGGGTSTKRIGACGLALALGVLCLPGCDPRPADYRMPVANVPVDAPLTDALLRAHYVLPEQVSSINCYLPNDTSVSCDVALAEQTAREMGGATFEWRYSEETVTFAGHSVDAGPIRNVGLDDMSGSHFQFVVVRNGDDGRPVVHANVDRSRVRFQSASLLVSEVVSEITDTAGPVFEAAHARTAAAIRETWPAAASVTDASGTGEH